MVSHQRLSLAALMFIFTLSWWPQASQATEGVGGLPKEVVEMLDQAHNRIIQIYEENKDNPAALQNNPELDAIFAELTKKSNEHFKSPQNVRTQMQHAFAILRQEMIEGKRPFRGSDFKTETLLAQDKKEQSSIQNKTSTQKWLKSQNLVRSHQVGLYKNDKKITTLLDLKLKKPFKGQSCSKVCPGTSEILKYNSGVFKTAQDNYFTPFINRRIEFQPIVYSQFGFCWGVTTLLGKFKSLAIFDPENKLKAKITQQEATSLEVLKEKIDDVVLRGQITVFPYVNGLREMEKYGAKPHLLEKGAYSWTINAISKDSFGALGPSTLVQTPEYNRSVIKELKARVAQNQMPEIMFNAVGIWGDSHVTRVFGVETSPAGDKILIEDPNYFPENIPSGGNVILLSPDGKFRYEPWLDTADLGLVKLTDEGKGFDRHVINTYKKYCEMNSGCK